MALFGLASIAFSLLSFTLGLALFDYVVGVAAALATT
jgi:hypothetical protein